MLQYSSLDTFKQQLNKNYDEKLIIKLKLVPNSLGKSLNSNDIWIQFDISKSF